jgi:hypothetical protein
MCHAESCSFRKTRRLIDDKQLNVASETEHFSAPPPPSGASCSTADARNKLHLHGPLRKGQAVTVEDAGSSRPAAPAKQLMPVAAQALQSATHELGLTEEEAQRQEEFLLLISNGA